jgi:predicted DsbA family dithiol-disulfide isomerase
VNADPAPLPVTVFADFTCPWSYLSEAILWRLAASGIELRYRARELYPGPDDPPLPDIAAADWSTIESLSGETGVHLRPPDVRPLTRKAHESACFARERGAEIAFRREVHDLYWRRGADIARIDVLTAAAEAVGLDGEELRIALDIDRHGPEVEEDQLVGDRLRIPGTPAIFLGVGAAARVVLGAQPVGELRRMVIEAIKTGRENE